MRKNIIALIGFALFFSIPTLARAAGTGNDILFFQGAFGTIDRVITNPYSGESIHTKGTYNEQPRRKQRGIKNKVELFTPQGAGY